MADSNVTQANVDVTRPCCVACHRPRTLGSALLKVLNCLHAMCVDCVQQNVSKDGTVTCFKCLTVAASGTPGARLEDCLVNWPAEDASNDSRKTALESRVPVCQDPECEGDDEIANSLCVDCDLRLCDPHGKIHTKKRTCRGHRVVASPGESCEAARDCPLHPSSPVKKYCWQCEELACDRCVALSHAGHSDLVDLQAVGDEKREDLRSQLDEVIDEWRDELCDAKETVSTRIQEINDRTEEVSAMISADIEEHINMIRKREKDLLHQLDQVRWTKVKELEVQLQLVAEATYKTECCDLLLSKLSNNDILASEQTLEGHIVGIRQRYGALLPAVDYDVTYKEFAHKESAVVSNLGAILMDVSEQQQVEVADSSVAHVMPYFDPFTLDHERFLLCNNNSQVQRLNDPGFSAVATLGAFCHGIVCCTFQVLEVRGMFLGVMGQKCSQQVVCTTGKPFLGWFSHNQNAEFCVGKGTRLGQTWKKGDVISLRLDCKNRRLTGRHERTGASETIKVPHGQMCFGAHLSGDSKLRIISKSLGKRSAN